MMLPYSHAMPRKLERKKRKKEDEAAADAAVGIYRIMRMRMYQNAETQTPSLKDQLGQDREVKDESRTTRKATR